METETSPEFERWWKQSSNLYLEGRDEWDADKSLAWKAWRAALDAVLSLFEEQDWDESNDESTN